MRTFQPSIVIEDTYERPIAVVQVTSRSDLPLDSAIRIRKSMLEEGLPAHIPYLLLVSQDIGFLWKNEPLFQMERSPDDEFSMESVIKRYSLRKPEQRLYVEELEYVVLHWLTNLSSKPQEMDNEPEKTLARAGFTDLIKESMVLIGEKFSC